MLVVSAPGMIWGFHGHSTKRVSEANARVVTMVVATTAVVVDSPGELKHLATFSISPVLS